MVSRLSSDNNASPSQKIGMMPSSSAEAMNLIVEKAKQLVYQLIDCRGHDRPPFLPKEYSHLVDIREIRKTDLGDTSGLLLRLHDGYVIKLNQDHYQVRQNFSCAHEIGHILLDDLKLDNYISNIMYRSYNPSKTAKIRARAVEALCDAAAAELLMPEVVFRKYLSASELSITSVEHLARTFQVSVQAAARRITEISIEPCIYIMWQPWPKSKPKRLRPVTQGQLRGRTDYTLVHKYINVRSALYRAYESDTLVKTWKLFKTGNTVDRLPVEARGFGRGSKRFVISFAFPNRKKLEAE